MAKRQLKAVLSLRVILLFAVLACGVTLRARGIQGTSLYDALLVGVVTALVLMQSQLVWSFSVRSARNVQTYKMGMRIRLSERSLN